MRKRKSKCIPLPQYQRKYSKEYTKIDIQIDIQRQIRLTQPRIPKLHNRPRQYETNALIPPLSRPKIWTATGVRGGPSMEARSIPHKPRRPETTQIHILLGGLITKLKHLTIIRFSGISHIFSE